MEPATPLENNEIVLNAGRDVLNKEAQSLLSLANMLDLNFSKAVQIILEISKNKGRVIVTGMGKSGHIGSKIAATLASTGTPAFAVHPGEASHGDLGMIMKDDAVLALSHSGETKELGDIVAHCARFNIPLIAMTGKENSALGRAADVCLLNGVTSEACPLNIAPTTSTTTTLALGDALAVALMNLRGFKSEDFASFHPGGKLGSQLLNAGSLMVTDIPLVAETSKMSEALLEITEKRLGVVGVTDKKGKLTGVITDGDLRRHMGADILEKTAKSVMSSSPKTISEELLSSAAVHMMQENKITALFVVKDNKPIGVLHIHNCLQAGVV